MSNCKCKTEKFLCQIVNVKLKISLHVKMIISMSIHTCKTENLSLIIHMCDDHHQLMRERGKEGGRERGREEGKQKDLGEDFNLASFQDCFFLWMLE